MKNTIGLIGDFNDKVIAHKAIPLALELANNALGTNVTWSWIETNTLSNDIQHLAEYAAIWVTPGSPYSNMSGVLDAIRFARENNRPFLGTCGGFQHAIIEYARNVCGILDSDHAETNQKETSSLSLPLSCSLVGKSEQLSFTKGSHLCSIFNGLTTLENYHCNYGLNAEWIAT